MKARQSGSFTILKIMACFALIFAFQGCSRVGPAYLKAGIGLYNEAINTTDAQQTLLTIVRNRYEENSTSLTVSAVTANIRVATNASLNVGIGPNENFAGNLVPFGAGAMYEENPTISYTPVQGRKYLRQVRSPIPLELLALLTRSGSPQIFPFLFIVRNINGVPNPDFLLSPSDESATRFNRLMEVMERLSRRGFLFLVQDPRKSFEYALVIHDPAQTGPQGAREFLELLDIPWPADESEDIVLPVVLALQKPTQTGIAIQTRSLWDLVDILSASIDVSQEDIESGTAVKFPPLGLVGGRIHIHCSQERPSNSTVSVKYHGAWFYIDETDQSTKLAFRIIQVLHSVMVADATKDVQTAPVLTVPVSR